MDFLTNRLSLAFAALAANRLLRCAAIPECARDEVRGKRCPQAGSIRAGAGQTRPVPGVRREKPLILCAFPGDSLAPFLLSELSRTVSSE